MFDVTPDFHSQLVLLLTLFRSPLFISSTITPVMRFSGDTHKFKTILNAASRMQYNFNKLLHFYVIIK